MKQTLLFLSWLVVVTNCQAQHTITLNHKYYTVQFDTVFCQGILNHYTQTIAHHNSPKLKRLGSVLTSFHKDPLIPERWQTVSKSDYANYNKPFKEDKHNTMDIGHIVDFRCMSFDSTAAKETMMFSTNTAFQISWFNEQMWKNIETIVFDSIGSKYDCEVYTGVLISLSHPKKYNQVYIPDYYFKVAVFNGNTLAWLGANTPENTSTKPSDVAIPIDKLKAIILQYYPRLQLGF
jgi:DNA/RNA endonuclease G (NUC1)